jgi:hypothetical protein
MLLAFPVLVSLALVCILLGMQVGLLRFTTNHAGLDIDGSLTACILLSLDNICHVLFLDTFEVYDINIGPKPEHTFLSSSVFLGFRVGYALAVVVVVAVYQGHLVHSLLNEAPTAEPSVPKLIAWIDHACGHERGWPRLFFDEFMFLLLIGEYLRGNFEMMAYLSRRFSRLDIRPEVRRLFLGPDGAELFQGSSPG